MQYIFSTIYLFSTTGGSVLPSPTAGRRPRRPISAANLVQIHFFERVHHMRQLD
jgi:hypothetical protein